MTIPVPPPSRWSERFPVRAWFNLTDQERWAVLIVLGLFLLGLGARAWHLGCGPEADRSPPSAVPAKGQVP